MRVTNKSISCTKLILLNLGSQSCIFWDDSLTCNGATSARTAHSKGDVPSADTALAFARASQGEQLLVHNGAVIKTQTFQWNPGWFIRGSLCHRLWNNPYITGLANPLCNPTNQGFARPSVGHQSRFLHCMVGWWFRRAFWCNINSGNDIDEVWLMLQLFWSYGETVKLLLIHSYSFQCNEKWSPTAVTHHFPPKHQVSSKIFCQPKTPKAIRSTTGWITWTSPWKPTLVSTCRRRRQSSQFPRCADHIKAFQPSGLRAFGRFCDWVATGQPPNPVGGKYIKIYMTVILQ